MIFLIATFGGRKLDFDMKHKLIRQLRPVKLVVKFISPWILFIALATGCAGLPSQEHYMLRSEYYRQLDSNRQLYEARKMALMERIAVLQSDEAREEGRRIQVERESEKYRRRLKDTSKELAAISADAEARADQANEDISFYLTKIKRLDVELKSTLDDVDELKTQREAEEQKAEEAALSAETSAVLFDSIEFPSASAALSQKMKDQIISGRDKIVSASHISVVGYTDNIEIKGPIYKSNWGLSAARAASVVEFITDSMDLDGKEITVVGRGTMDPKYPNDSAKNRELNRRVEVIAVYR